MGQLTHSPAKILQTLLIDLSQGTSPAANGSWPVHVTNEPTAPDECITVFNTEGYPGLRGFPDGEVVGPKGIQVRVRSSRPDNGFTKASAVKTCLEETIYRNTVTINSSVYLVHCCSRIGNVIDAGKDSPESKRNIHTINCVMSVVQCS